MDRKISKFAVGDEITTLQSIRNWATGKDTTLATAKVYSITEDHRGIHYRTITSHDGIHYRTITSHDHHQELVVSPGEAKGLALKFLAERMIKISEQEDPRDRATR